MSDKRWDDYLVAEHEMIERAMEVMKTELGEFVPGRKASQENGWIQKLEGQKVLLGS